MVPWGGSPLVPELLVEAKPPFSPIPFRLSIGTESLSHFSLGSENIMSD